ncbi:unnamed protein product [Closterium sp. Naga37s-1]|nr:unnamed protein product [Closterium sp. Naga37s-1]
MRMNMKHLGLRSEYHVKMRGAMDGERALEEAARQAREEQAGRQQAEAAVEEERAVAAAAVAGQMSAEQRLMEAQARVQLLEGEVDSLKVGEGGEWRGVEGRGGEGRGGEGRGGEGRGREGRGGGMGFTSPLTNPLSSTRLPTPSRALVLPCGVWAWEQEVAASKDSLLAAVKEETMRNADMLLAAANTRKVTYGNSLALPRPLHHPSFHLHSLSLSPFPPFPPSLYRASLSTLPTSPLSLLPFFPASIVCPLLPCVDCFSPSPLPPAPFPPLCVWCVVCGGGQELAGAEARIAALQGSVVALEAEVRQQDQLLSDIRANAVSSADALRTAAQINQMNQVGGRECCWVVQARGHMGWDSLLVGALLVGALLVGALLVGALLVGALLVGALLVGALLVGALLVGALLVGALLVGALLVGALLVGPECSAGARGGAAGAASDLTQKPPHACPLPAHPPCLWWWQDLNAAREREAELVEQLEQREAEVESLRRDTTENIRAQRAELALREAERRARELEMERESLRRGVAKRDQALGLMKRELERSAHMLSAAADTRQVSPAAHTRQVSPAAHTRQVSPAAHTRQALRSMKEQMEWMQEEARVKEERLAALQEEFVSALKGTTFPSLVHASCMRA